MSESLFPKKDGGTVSVDDRVISDDKPVFDLLDSTFDKADMDDKQSAVADVAVPMTEHSGAWDGFTLVGDFFRLGDKYPQFQVSRELMAHYELLLAYGWKPTKWEHPEHGTEERTPLGGWKWTNRDGEKSYDRGGSDHKTYADGKLIAYRGRKVSP